MSQLFFAPGEIITHEAKSTAAKPSVLSRAWQSLTGSTADADYELEMPWNLPKGITPTYAPTNTAGEEVLIDPLVANLASRAKPKGEQIVEMDDAITDADVDGFIQRLSVFGPDRFFNAVRTMHAAGGLVTNEATAQAMADMNLFIQAEGGQERLGRLLDAVKEKAQALQPPALPSDPQREGLIGDIIIHAGDIWSDSDLHRLDTNILRKIHSDVLPRDYSGNAGYYRQMGSETEELQPPWPKFEDKSFEQWKAPESPNNILRRMSQNGNGSHKG